jgi:redox-sensitive bicupin YhaK (pirin superfamily)
MKKIIQRSSERGISEFGWLHSRHSFSFGSYYNPLKERFGLLRVLNDDIVEPGEGFGTHHHDNMEIISIVLKGQLEHRDSMGNGSIIQEGDVQVMSAGSGITHSEFNPSEFEKVNFLQLWIYPSEKNVKPRYDQKKFIFTANDIKKIVSNNKSGDELYINQDASIYFGKLNEQEEYSFTIDKKDYGSYLFLLEGSVILDNDTLNKRDAAGINETDRFSIKSVSQSEFIVINVPMN